MAYNLVSTDEMDRLLDETIAYLIHKLKSEQAASHLIRSVETVYNNLEYNPYTYQLSRDPYLYFREYREAIVPEMDYIIIYKVVREDVFLLGIFHSSENYSDKMRVIWELYWNHCNGGK